MHRWVELSGRELAVLESLLKFYDRFAELNETNPQLVEETAKAYRKMASIQRRLGRVKEAQEAHGKALKRYRSLVGLHGEDSDSHYELARTLAMDAPGADAVPWEQAEPDLRQAIAIVERMFERAAPDRKSTYAAALARWDDRLGRGLEEAGKTDEVLRRYRDSIAYDEWLAEHVDDLKATGVRFMLVVRRAILARFLIRLDRKDEARPLAERAADDVIRLAGEDGRGLKGPGEMIVRGLEDLGSISRDVGDEGRATRLEALAQKVRERPDEWGPGHHDGGGFGNPKKGSRGNGRGRMDGPPPENRGGPF